MSAPNHFSSPMLSNWQSAVAKVATSPAVHNAGNPFVSAIDRLPLNFHDAFVSAAAFAAHAAQATIDSKDVPVPANDVERAAKLVLNLALSKLQHDDEGVKATQAELAKFGECDPRWAECVAEFVSHYAVTRHADVPYRRWHSLDDFVHDRGELPDRCRIGIIGDWGTGDARAQAVLERVAAHDVQVLIHLGDIYYSCTTTEAGVFYDNVRRAFPREADTRIFSLCGNHDMYSGGAPYYALVDRLDHKASFFCLRNAAWQILAGDTGYNDFNPLTHGGIGSWIQDFDDRGSPYSELAWHADKFRTAGGRRTIFLTHHQPFSVNAAIDGDQAVNRRLLAQLKPHLPDVDLWIWGHEHNQVCYAPYEGVGRGRCVGASAIPVPKDVDLVAPDPAIRTPLPSRLAGALPLGVDRATDWYNLGFAILELDGVRCSERHFELNTTSGAERVLYESSFEAGQRPSA